MDSDKDTPESISLEEFGPSGSGRRKNEWIGKRLIQSNDENYCAEVEQEATSNFPSTTKFNFYLLILGEKVVEQAYIHFGPGEFDKKKLERVQGESKLWKCSLSLVGDPIKEGLMYKYGLKSKRHSVPWVTGRVGFGNDPSCCEENGERPVLSQDHLDVFMFPSEDKKYIKETIPMSVVFYLKWFFECVLPSSMCEILTQVQELKFSLLQEKHLKLCVNWIVEQALNTSVNNQQLLYLCIILGHLERFRPPITLSSSNNIAQACDRLLGCLNACIYSKFLSAPDLQLLEKIAVLLVKNSSHPGWLTFAAYFHSYLGIEFILENESANDLKYIYDDKGFGSMVELLLSSIEIESSTIKSLLHFVLKLAPTSDCAIEFFTHPKVRKVFENDDKFDDSFIEFYKSENAKSQNKSVGPKLCEFFKLPRSIRANMQDVLFRILLEFSKSDEELKDEQVNIFLKAVNLEDLSMDQVREILLGLSKSSHRYDLLLNILERRSFWEAWQKVPHADKVNICKSWIITRLTNEGWGNSLGSTGKVAAVFGAIDAIMKVSINVLDNDLVQKVSSFVVETILRNEDASIVLNAYPHVEKCATSVQEFYKCFASKKIEQMPNVVTKSWRNTFKETPKSREGPLLHDQLGQELLTCILKIVAVPEVGKKSVINEDDFQKILDWSEFWIILFETITGTVEKNTKYQAGRDVCRQLAKCIKEGDISLTFLELLEQEKEEVSMLCAHVLNKSSPKSTPALLKWEIDEKISELRNHVRDCFKKFELLESAINYGKRVSNDVYQVNGIPTIIETLNDLKESVRSKKIKELQANTFWGKLLPFLPPAEALQPLIKSLSFMSLTKKCLEKLTDSSADEATTCINDFHSLITFLTTKCIEELQAQWNPVLDDPGSLSVEAIKSLLETMRRQNRLDEELELLETYFHRKFSPVVKIYLEDYVNYPNVLEQVRQVLGVLRIFKLEDPSNEFVNVLLQCQASLENSNELTLETLHKSMEGVKQKNLSFLFSEDMGNLMAELSRSNALLGFIENIVDEDIRFLTDAVEEHSDQFLSESSVSDLIVVHGFLAPLIKTKNQKKCDPQDFLKKLKESSLGHKGIKSKIKHCSTNVNSLRGLYTSIANRSEITKEIIGNCLNKGEYWMAQRHGKCEAMMSYILEENSENKIRSYSMAELHDLRSRAHLIVTSHKNAVKIPSSPPEESSEDIDFDEFIHQVNLLTESATLLSKLHSSGYVKYREFRRRMVTTDELQTIKDTLQNDLKNWENILRNARKEFYFLNYFRSDQLCMLYDFLMWQHDVNWDEVLSLIHFVDRTITKEKLGQYQRPRNELKKSESDDSPELLLSTVGEALRNIFCNSKRVIRHIQASGDSQPQPKLETTVTPGEIFIARLEPESPLTANVILALYKNTSNAYPQPHEIVFCSSQTTWEELHLLLQRCFAHSKHVRHKSLFCIANVELLPNELQFTLVDAIREKQESYKSSQAIKENADYQLALICRGGDHHHVVEQFTQYSHHVAGMDDNALGNCLKSGWPHVKTITSTLPGLGKTEKIQSEALEESMNVATFLISGPFEPSKLVRRLKELKLKKYHCLHLDVGEVSDPLLLDIFLFQLIVTGMVSAGNQFYHLPSFTTHIYIEIANTLKDWLRESLVMSKYFTRIHLHWQNYTNLLVSTEVNSSVQVVCQYLNLFDRSCVDLKEIDFFGPQKPDPLPTQRCQELLASYFSSDAEITFTTLNVFVRVLAGQLLKFSTSPFFEIRNLKFMTGHEARNVRYNLVGALLNVSKEFASRAITTCRSNESRNLSQKESSRALDRAMESTGRSAKDMVERAKDMIKWEDSNHLLVVFHGIDSQCITAIYRNKSAVPLSVEKLLKSQVVTGKKELEDFKVFTQEQLQEKLEKIACMKVVEKSNLFPSYALTPDNILKMILIILRIRVNVPVIIMGETGCGKTSLVRYLANTCGVRFHKFDFHAGISEDKIIEFIKEKERNTVKTKEQTWIFLDEINTCDHLGLISDIMCHHSLLGQSLSKNLVFIAACNPYRLRPEQSIKTAGIKVAKISDEYSGLVYRVHPLPEAMIDYVWDYGSLAPKDERDYIQRMVRDLPKEHAGRLVDVLVESQQFTRDAEKNPFCVSLRDVRRCIRLVGWFRDMTKKRQVLNCSKYQCPTHLRQYNDMSKRYNEKPMIKSIVLALAHCYMSRLPTAELRKNYRQRMIDMLKKNGTIMEFNENLDSFLAIVRMEEEDYLDRMELPSGTARNAALRENVFVMLVCILNRIPIFVVGKPGCSKSLSVQLIRSNLRGRDSRDPLFREFPQLYVVSYQGSESSTSKGIEKVFEKAHNYKSHNENVLPVVLLDEVGLAENSKYNPLKVLHSLLEPGEGKLPDVAVVGISNWSLDAAKMNRAIHLSRPEPTKEDLCETGYSLHYAEHEAQDLVNSQHLSKEELQCLAEAYFEYQNLQTHANFHGLRDYYALIKSLTGCGNFQEVNISLQRNFGGLPGEVTNIQKIFLDKLKKLMISSAQDVISVTKLIQANLQDLHARHLMLITSGDSAIGILKQSLEKLEKETIALYGSRFQEDLSEEYNYRILSRIILCMERECILILKDLESIYGSLYDMLNQNYAIVGSRKTCRVALGAYSNPMCQVHDGFRCIVLIDQHKVDYSDPPFLNRFEKQILGFSDVLTKGQQKVVFDLRCWVKGMSTLEGFESHFSEKDLFIGFHEDTLPSLVLSHFRDTDNPSEDVFNKCKDELMWIASPDGVLRTQNCKRLRDDFLDVQKLSTEYFKKPLHKGLAAFMKYVRMNYQELQSFFAGDEIGTKIVVMTFSNIHTDIRQCLHSENDLKCEVIRLSAYKSEKHLAERINEFWSSLEKELLVLQCKPDLDGSHLLLARSIIEEKRNSYKKCLPDIKRKTVKHVCIVVHVQRGEAADSVPWQFSFLCGWRQVFLDVLEAPPVPLNEILGERVEKLLRSSIWPIRKIARNDLLWCFTCIKYARGQRPVDAVLRIAKNLFSSQKVSEVIEKLILQSIEQNVSEQDQEASFKQNWQVKVACDRQSLINSATLYSALEQYVSRLVRNPLAKIVFFLEKENAWPPHLVNDCNESRMPMLEELWCKLIMNSAILNIADISEPLGAESYTLNSTSLDLCLPFSQLVHRKIDRVVKELFLEDYASLLQDEDNLDDDGKLSRIVRQQQLAKFSKMIINLLPEFHCYPSDCYDLYMKDVFDIATADFGVLLDCQKRVCIAKVTFVSETKRMLPVKDMLELCTLLHTFLWIHQEQMLHLVRLVDCCQRFIPVLLNVTDDVFRSFEEVVFLQGHEFADVASDNQDGEEEVIIEEIQQYEDPKRFGDYLVTTYCEEMFPSQEIVVKNGGLKSWMRNASLLLSLGIKIIENSPAFHYLRLCVDFSRIICTADSLTTSLRFLYTLKEIGMHHRPDYLDHQEVFETITTQVIKPLEEEKKDPKTDKQKALQMFLALFYGRCVETNVDTSLARPIMEQVLSLDKPELVMLMSRVVLTLLTVEEEEDRRSIFMELITNPHVIEHYSCLKNIDEVFKDCFAKKLIHYYSYPAVMICDLIQRQLHFKIDDINSSDFQVIKLIRSAKTLVSQNSDGDCGLRVLSAVAVLREFFSMLAKFVAKNHDTFLSKNSPISHVIKEIDSLLQGPKPALHLFFMKQLHQVASLYDLQKWFGENEALLSVKELWREEKKLKKAKFTAVLKCSEYEEAKAAYFRLKGNDDSSMQKFLTNCADSPKYAFALLGFLINMVYLERAVRILSDPEERIVDWFVDKIALLPSLFQKLLLRVIGHCEFDCSQLRISPESSVEDVEMALLVLHIVCVIATGALSEDLPVYQYLTNPAKYEQPCVLAHCKEDIHSVFEYQLLVKDPVCVTCACGSKLAFKSKVNEIACPHCQVVFNDNTSRSISPETPATVSMSINDKKCPEWYRCTREMNPAVYRGLRLIVYSSYYAGVALGLSSEESLLIALKRLHINELNNDSIRPSNFCFENVKSDLLCLMNILSCKQNVAIKTMHLVVDKSSDLIRSNNLLPTNSNDCSTSIREWEVMFSQLTEKLFLHAKEASTEIKRMMMLEQNENGQEFGLDCRMLELDNYTEEADDQNRLLDRLFRVTKQPSFDDFVSAFLHSPKDVQLKHSFLALFFSKYDQIQIICNLHHLLKWSRLVSLALTHRISRKDAQSKSFNDFISGHLLELKREKHHQERLRKIFKNFKTAWNKLRPTVNEQLAKKQTEMPRIRETDSLAYCLTESDYGIYLQAAIDILVSYQNSLLDAIISLSSCHLPALSFLEYENCSAIPSTSIQNVKETEIISFQWSNDLFQHASNNPEYGRGQQITYDFQRIEMELAAEIAFGKSYLKGTFNDAGRFIFAKELFHSCGPLLTEIRSLVRQTPSLPEEVQRGLLDLKERRIKDAQHLLQHVEILIYLLNRKLKYFDTDMTLEELAETWSPLLPSPFPVDLLPEPKSSIKIEHVAALYEALEDILADGAIEGLADKFRAELPVAMEGTVSNILEKDIDQLKPHILLKALRRFVFRYLSLESKRYWPDENTALQSCLEEASLWFPLEAPNLEEISRDITLEYMHSMVKYLEEVEKKRKDNTGRTGLRSSSRRQQGRKPGRRRPKMSRS